MAAADSGVFVPWRRVALGVRLKGGISGRALGFGEGEDGPKRSSAKTLSSGEEGLLAFAGGRPVGVEGGALFLPFRGVVDIYKE
jgi:hypothetical protein